MQNWSSFKFELRFDAARLQRDIIKIEAYRLSLNQLYLPREWRDDLQKLYITRAVHGTTAIEGNPLNEAQVALQLERPKPAAKLDEVHRQTANAEQAFRWIEQEFARPRPFVINDVTGIHRMLTTGSDEHDHVPGQIRKSGHNVTVGSLELGGVHRAPPGGAAIDRLTKQFLSFVNSAAFRRENVAVKALAAHFYYVTLHPFGNGNGRTTRCIEAAILHAGGYNTYGFYSLSNYFYRNRDQYFRTLQATRTKHCFDLTEFILFGLRGFREELERINAYVRNRTHRLHYRELIRKCSGQIVGKRRRLLNDREARLLHWMLDKSAPRDPLSDEPARELALKDFFDLQESLYSGKSYRTLVRELLRLAQLDFILIEGENGPSDWRVRINFEAIRRY